MAFHDRLSLLDSKQYQTIQLAQKILLGIFGGSVLEKGDEPSRIPNNVIGLPTNLCLVHAFPFFECSVEVHSRSTNVMPY